jgi:hypothetical protein
MTNSARLSADIEFADGKTRTVRPLTIKKLRKFMKIAEKLDVGSTGTLTDDDIDKMMEAAAIIMEDIDPELAANGELLEDALDVETFWKIMQVAMGNKLADPNE